MFNGLTVSFETQKELNRLKTQYAFYRGVNLVNHIWN